MKRQNMQNKKKKIFQIIKWVLALVVFIVVTWQAVKYAPQLKRIMTDRDTAQKLENWLNSFGAFGVMVLFLLQILQVFIAFLPSEPIEIAAGMTYGGMWGFLLCGVGVWLGSWLVFRMIKRFGTPFVEKLISRKKLKEFSFLENTQRMEMITFILYFIPGLPKDVFTYFAALTQLSTKRFLTISIIARTPSILVSTIAGAQFMEGNYQITIWIFAIFSLLGVIGMFCYKLIAGRLDQKQMEKQEEPDDTEK